MQMKIVSYRRGRKTQRVNQAVVSIPNVSDRNDAQKYIGKRVEIKFSKNSINGVITRVHGGKGRVVVRFRRGLPGQAITRQIDSKD